MNSKLKLIQSAQAANVAQRQMEQQIVETITILAETAGITADSLTESVTHVLANIANTVTNGQPLEVMNAKSIADFLAGVDKISTTLPNAQDEVKKQNTIRALTAASLLNDGTPNMAVVTIVQYGAKNTELTDKYTKIVMDYMNSVQSGNPRGQELANIVRSLQQKIDQSMRISMQPARQSSAPVGPSAPGVTPSATAGA